MQIPNCVPEYYRELQEREEHEYEKACKQYEYYVESKRRLDEAHRLGHKVMLYGGFYKCHKCEKKFDLQLDAEDDFCALVCYDKNCECHKREDEDDEA